MCYNATLLLEYAIGKEVTMRTEMTESRISNTHERNTMKGTVTRKTHGIYTVTTDDGQYLCRISNKLRKELVYPIASNRSLRRRVVTVEEIKKVDPVAIGDDVMFKLGEDGVNGMIQEILPRKNYMSRLGSGRKPIEQVIVSNIDQAIIIASATYPKTNMFTIDRYLADAEMSKIPSVILVTKVDLVDREKIEKEFCIYKDIGYPVVFTSSIDEVGIDDAKDILMDKRSVLLGRSGVGKSSLLNAIQPELGLKVREVHNKTGEGMHTTTHLEMYSLDMGGEIVDTPGMREFGLWRCTEMDWADLFPEMRSLVDKCRFGESCRHVSEPGCAVIEAVSDGRIAVSRYESYCKLAETSEELLKSLREGRKPR
jgi:ribosome biogenesis GTPase / thiamine phosphate phosphatase